MKVFKTNLILKSITPVIIEELIKEYWYKDIQQSRLNNNYNFLLNAKYFEVEYELCKLLLNYSKQLYNIDLECVKTTGVYAYVSNQNFYDSVIHNHKETHTITGVYYINVPKSNGGELNFYDNDYKFLTKIKPKTNDFIIFDGSLNHQPLPSNSNEYRISLNTGIQIYDRTR